MAKDKRWIWKDDRPQEVMGQHIQGSDKGGPWEYFVYERKQYLCGYTLPTLIDKLLKIEKRRLDELVRSLEVSREKIKRLEVYQGGEG